MLQDGFGQRSVTIDHAAGDWVALLSFDPALAAAPGFGEAIGQRVARLSRVRHAMYARVRKLDRTSETGLVLYSDRVEGWRLAEVLRVMEREGLTLDISAILVLLRQLIPAVGLFSRHQRDAAIGTVGPERLILTPQGRLVVAEYVLAPGLERLQYSRERLWRELRVAVPPTASPSRIPPSADVVGIGVVALSLLIGRRLREDEYLVSLGELVDSATERHAGSSRKLSPGFAAWLGRALQFHEHQGLRSTQEAQIAFEEMLAKERSYMTAPGQLELFIEKYERLLTGDGVPSDPNRVVRTSLEDEPASTEAMPAPAPAAAAVPDAANAVPPAAASVATVTAAAAAAPAPSTAGAASVGAASGDGVPASTAAVPPAPETNVPAPPLAAVPDAPITPSLPGRSWMQIAAATLAAVAIGEAVAIGMLLSRTPAPVGESGELVVQSRPVAARVSIDGEERGITPYTTELSPGSHVIEVRVGRSEPRVIPVEIRGGVQSGIYVELQSVATVGGLEVRSAPASARVSVGGQYRGVTPLVLKDLPPGDVEVLLQAGRREVRQTVRIEPGITSQLVVPLER